MSINIHQTTIVHKNSIVGQHVSIGPYSVIDENVKIGDNTIIGNNVHITGWTDIGKNNKIHSHVIMGDEPQDLSYTKERSYVIIGDNNIFREGVTVHRGTKPESRTIIGNNNMFMVYSHVGHNCELGNNIILVNFASLGGYVEVGDRVFISHAGAVHQFCRIGRMVMVAPLSKVGKDVPPFMMVSGYETAEVRGLNVVGMRRGEITSNDREIIKKAYKVLYHSKLNTKQALEKIGGDSELSSNVYVQELIEFVKKAKRGISAHYQKEKMDWDEEI